MTGDATSDASSVAPALPERLRLLNIDLAGAPCGRLTHGSTYVFQYGRDDPQQPSLSLLMPAGALQYADGAIFPAMDMNLPEGYLFQQIRELFPKQPLTPMHLLALMGDNGIGRIGYSLPERPRTKPASLVRKQDLLGSTKGQDVFRELMRAYLSTGAGISGIQPKILVPDRATIPVPTLIVKVAAARYPGLAANEYMCLNAARHAGVEVSSFELSADGELLVLDRFDIGTDGSRLGFEDIASLMGLRVRDALSNRKYRGSYQSVAEVLRLIGLADADLARFYDQLAVCAMVRNGDGHLKNFGVLYSSDQDARLAPMFDVVTTSIYPYQRYEGGPELEDRTMALRLFSGSRSKVYPPIEELLEFGRAVCGVTQPQRVLQRIGEGMRKALEEARHDDRIPGILVSQMEGAWESGLLYASAAGTATPRARSRLLSRKKSPP